MGREAGRISSYYLFSISPKILPLPLSKQSEIKKVMRKGKEEKI